MRNRRWGTLCCGVFLGAMLVIFSVLEATALEIAGVDVPQSLIIENKALILNGAGIRKKVIFKIYVGSLYLTKKQTIVGKILSDPGAKSIVMNFLYKEVSTRKLVEGWNKGFSQNSSKQEMRALKDRIDKFNSLFVTVYKGDEIRLDYLPGVGTQVKINGKLKGSIPGEDFHRALLKIWLGSKPADANLKEEMLGNAY